MPRLVDLSLELYDGLSTGPGGPKMAIMNRISHDWSAPRYLPPARGGCDRVMMLNEHIGTHVDAPFHFLKEGRPIDQVDLDTFWGPAVLADASDRDPSTPVTVEQITRDLARTGTELRPGDILIVKSWAGDRESESFARAMALAPEVGPWLVEQQVKAIGFDLPNIDSPGDRSFPVHMAVLEAGIIIFESLTNLDAIGQSRFTFMGLPWRLVGGSGCPIRAVAMVED